MKQEPYKIIIEQSNSPNIAILGEIFELLITKETQSENTKDKGNQDP